jgi:hypothetical protein
LVTTITAVSPETDTDTPNLSNEVPSEAVNIGGLFVGEVVGDILLLVVGETDGETVGLVVGEVLGDTLGLVVGKAEIVE